MKTPYITYQAKNPLTRELVEARYTCLITFAVFFSDGRGPEWCGTYEVAMREAMRVGRPNETSLVTPVVVVK